ncbi:MAG: DUF3018 family protein [Candidatus Devosia phytovorans]|uniref:DUF3018 family protein n=1 Tax=Candidatus Devosia phytovorans TaxID=3121372 RepID=A0AAJ5VQS9_9HYPH|nr:antitoxin MazE-like protein [Devosia sp.]WEK03041.1 MAG: DUF3018 family protein [Devosia sp.]
MSRSAKRNTEIDEAAMRAKGLVPKTIWVPDVDAPGLVEEYARQVRLVAESDAQDPSIESFSQAALEDLDLPPYDER